MRAKPATKFLRDEGGAVAIIATVSMVCFLSLMAVTLDVGSAYINTGRLQKTADAAVYSAGRMLPVSVSDTQAQDMIKDTAIDYASLNGIGGLTRDDVVLGAVVRDMYTELEVTVTHDFDMNFARVFGVDSVLLTRSAKVKLSPVAKITGLAPLGVKKDELESRIDSGDLEHVVLKYGVKSGESSSFGALDLSGHGGGSDYRMWLSQGYEGEIGIGDVLLEQPGNIVGPTYQGFSARYDACTHFGAHADGNGCTIEHYVPSCPRIIQVAVYEVDSSDTVSVCGFASFLLEDQTQDGFITGTFLSMIASGQATGEDLSESESDFGTYNLVLTN